MYLCDFHREQAWDRWLKETKHGCKDIKEDILPRLRRVAKAPTEGEYNASLIALQNSPNWNLPNSKMLQKWFESKWIPEHGVSKFDTLYRKS